jgi:hypothetical protein
MPGVNVDPVSGRPVDYDQPVDQAKVHAEQKRLEALAGHAGISQSEAAKTMIALVEEALIQRVESLLLDDQACKTLLNVLRAVGNIEFTAAQAVKRLTGRQLKLSPRSAGH